MYLPFATSYTVRTYTVGYDANGRATESGPTEESILAMVTPNADRTLSRMPEGLREKARFRVRTKANLGDLGSTATNKHIVVDGREYQLDQWGRWNVPDFGNLNHNRYLASEV